MTSNQQLLARVDELEQQVICLQSVLFFHLIMDAKREGTLTPQYREFLAASLGIDNPPFAKTRPEPEAEPDTPDRDDDETSDLVLDISEDDIPDRDDDTLGIDIPDE